MERKMRRKEGKHFGQVLFLDSRGLFLICRLIFVIEFRSRKFTNINFGNLYRIPEMSAVDEMSHVCKKCGNVLTVMKVLVEWN